MSLRTTPAPATTGTPFVGAPICFLGGWLLMRPIGGGLVPGLWWTAAHSVWLCGFVLFAALGLQSRRIPTTGWRRVVGEVGAWAVIISAGANIAQMVIDLIGGFLARDGAEMREFFDQVSSYPGVQPVVYGVGAQLIFIGLILVAVAITNHWSAGLVAISVVVLFGTVTAFGRNHWLVLVGMVLLCLGLASLGTQLRRTQR